MQIIDPGWDSLSVVRRAWLLVAVSVAACSGEELSPIDEPGVAVSCPEGSSLVDEQMSSHDYRSSEASAAWRIACRDAAGLLHGPAKEVLTYPAAPPKRMAEGNYRDNQRDGTWRTYYEAGRLRTVVGYRMGKKDGVYDLNSPEGRSITRGMYRDGVQHGTWYDYDPPGEMSRTYHFEDGKEIWSQDAPARGKTKTVNPRLRPAEGEAPSPWPADALWELGQMILVLLVLLALAATTAKRTLGAGLRRLRDAGRVPPHALAVIVAAMITATGGWLMQAGDLGFAQVLAMALGGPSAQEIARCHATIRHERSCPYGGAVVGNTCSKHGAKRWPDR